MFSEQKWNILKSLSYEKSSPLQLAEKLNDNGQCQPAAKAS